MRVRNPKGKEFPVTRDFWENAIVSKGNADRYEVIEDDAPLEVKRLIEIKKKTSKVEKPETNKD